MKKCILCGNEHDLVAMCPPSDPKKRVDPAPASTISTEPSQASSPSATIVESQSKQPINSENQNNNLDFKKLAQFIIALGILVLMVGGFMWGSNQPKTFASSATQSGQNAFDAIAQSVHDSEARMQVEDDNMRARQEQDKATKVMIAGGIVIFIGIAFSASVKKK